MAEAKRVTILFGEQQRGPSYLLRNTFLIYPPTYVGINTHVYKHTNICTGMHICLCTYTCVSTHISWKPNPYWRNVMQTVFFYSFEQFRFTPKALNFSLCRTFSILSNYSYVVPIIFASNIY